MIHPPSTSELERLYPDMVFSDVFHDYPIGEVVRYWTRLLIDNGVRLDKINIDESPWRKLPKSFPWTVTILHMYSYTIPDLYANDCYKINFNLECRDVIVDDSQECEVVALKNKGISVRHTGTLGYSLSKGERDFTEGFFKGKWLDYLEIQGSRIIVQFWLENYYPIFRKEKILTIQNKLLSL